MKKFITLLLLSFLTLILVLIVRTFTYQFKKIEKTGDNEVVLTAPSEKAIRRFAGGICIPTISNEFYEETNFGPFEEFMRYLSDSYPEVYKVMDTDTINTYGMIFHWKGKNSTLKPVLFLSHYDVVPVIGYDQSIITDTIFQLNDKPLPPIQSYATKWDYPPFSGAVINGRIYGR